MLFYEWKPSSQVNNTVRWSRRSRFGHGEPTESTWPDHSSVHRVNDANTFENFSIIGEKMKRKMKKTIKQYDKTIRPKKDQGKNKTKPKYFSWNKSVKMKFKRIQKDHGQCWKIFLLNKSVAGIAQHFSLIPVVFMMMLVALLGGGTRRRGELVELLVQHVLKTRDCFCPAEAAFSSNRLTAGLRPVASGGEDCWSSAWFVMSFLVWMPGFLSVWWGRSGALHRNREWHWRGLGGRRALVSGGDGTIARCRGCRWSGSQHPARRVRLCGRGPTARVEKHHFLINKKVWW